MHSYLDVLQALTTYQLSLVMNWLAKAQVVCPQRDPSSWVTCDFVLGSGLNVKIIASSS